MPANPLQTDGVIGHLTDEQEDLLKEFWLEFFRLIDNAPEKGTASGADKSGTDIEEQDEKNPGKSIPKDDDAKDRIRAEKELKDAKAALEKYGRKRFLKTFWDFIAMDDPDALQLRFLRARKWEVPRGTAMLAACMKWRIESGVEDIVEKGEEGLASKPKFIDQLRCGKTYTQGTDRAGRPVCYIHVGMHKTNGQPAETMQTFVFEQMEAVRLLLADRAEKVSIVFDMTGFGLANMDWRVILLLVKCLEAYYPESLNVMITYKAPFIFSGIWKILGPMFDPVVRNKVQFCKTPEDLMEHIPREHLVKKLGGDCDFQWNYKEVEKGENDLMRDKKERERLQKQRNKMIAKYMDITRKWAKKNDRVLDLQRQYMATLMRDHYFVLDRYIRGRTCYHRNGNVKGDGRIYFDYPGVNQEELLGKTKDRRALKKKLDKLTEEIKAEGGKVPFDIAALEE